MAKPFRLPFMRTPPGVATGTSRFMGSPLSPDESLSTDTGLSGDIGLSADTGLSGDTGLSYEGSGQSFALQPTQPTDDTPDLVKEMRKLGALPTQEEVTTEQRTQQERENRAWYWDMLMVPSQMVGAEMIKSMVAGGGREGALGVAKGFLQSNPLTFFLDYITPDSIMPTWSKSRETTAAEMREAFGGSGEFSWWDLPIEILADPLTYISFGSTSALKAIEAARLAHVAKGADAASDATIAMRAISAANVVKYQSRTARAQEGAWYFATIGVPFSKKMKMPVTSLLGGAPKTGFHAFDIGAAKAIDAISDRIQRVPGMRKFIEFTSKTPIIGAGKKGGLIAAQRRFYEEVNSIQQKFNESMANLDPMIRAAIQQNGDVAQALTNLVEIGAIKLDDRAAILNSFAAFDEMRNNAVVDMLRAKDENFAKAWDILTDKSLADTQAWQDSIEIIYHKYPEVILDTGLLRKTKLAPRFGLDIPVNNYAELSDAIKAEFAARGLDASLFTTLSPEQLARLGVAREVGTKALEARSAIRAKAVATTFKGIDEIAAKGPEALKHLEDAVGVYRTYLNRMRDAEVAAGVLDSTLTNYFPRIITPAGRTLIQEQGLNFITKVLGENHPLQTFMRTRKLDDTWLTTEYNTYMSQLSEELLKKKGKIREGLTAEKYADLVAKHGHIQAATQAMFDPQFIKQLRMNGDYEVAEFFFANPAQATLLRSDASGKVMGINAFWQQFLHADSAYTYGTARTTDPTATLALIRRANESGGKLKIVTRSKTGELVTVDADSVASRLSHLEYDAETKLHLEVLHRQVEEQLTTNKAALSEITDALQESVVTLLDPKYVPGAALTKNPQAAELVKQLRMVAGNIEELTQRRKALAEFQVKLVQSTTRSPRAALTGVETQSARKKVGKLLAQTPDTETTSAVRKRLKLTSLKGTLREIQKEASAKIRIIRSDKLLPIESMEQQVETVRAGVKARTKQLLDDAITKEPRYLLQGQHTVEGGAVTIEELINDSVGGPIIERAKSLGDLRTTLQTEYNHAVSQLDVAIRNRDMLAASKAPTWLNLQAEIQKLKEGKFVSGDTPSQLELTPFSRNLSPETTPAMRRLQKVMVSTGRVLKKPAIGGGVRDALYADAETAVAVWTEEVKRLRPHVERSRSTVRAIESTKEKLLKLEETLVAKETELKTFTDSEDLIAEVTALRQAKSDLKKELAELTQQRLTQKAAATQSGGSYSDLDALQANIEHGEADYGAAQMERKGFADILGNKVAEVPVVTIDDIILYNIDPTQPLTADIVKRTRTTTAAGLGRRVELAKDMLRQLKAATSVKKARRVDPAKIKALEQHVETLKELKGKIEYTDEVNTVLDELEYLHKTYKEAFRPDAETLITQKPVPYTDLQDPVPSTDLQDLVPYTDLQKQAMGRIKYKIVGASTAATPSKHVFLPNLPDRTIRGLRRYRNRLAHAISKREDKLNAFIGGNEPLPGDRIGDIRAKLLGYYSEVDTHLDQFKGTANVITVDHANDIIAKAYGDTDLTTKAVHDHRAITTVEEIKERIKRVKGALTRTQNTTTKEANITARPGARLSEDDTVRLKQHLQQLRKLKKLYTTESEIRKGLNADKNLMLELSYKARRGEIKATTVPGVYKPASLRDKPDNIAAALKAESEGEDITEAFEKASGPTSPSIRIPSQHYKTRYKQFVQGSKYAEGTTLTPYQGYLMSPLERRLGVTGKNAYHIAEDMIAAVDHEIATQIKSQDSQLNAIHDFIIEQRVAAKEIRDGIRASGIERREMFFSKRLKGGAHDQMAASMYATKRNGGVLAFDQLSPEQQASLLSGTVDQELHLVDSEAFTEGVRLSRDMASPDNLRRYPIVRMMDQFLNWYKPFTAAGLMFLGSRARDVSQNLTTLASAGLVTKDGMGAALRVRGAIRKAVTEGKDIAHYIPDEVFKYVDETGNVVESNLRSMVQEAQRRGLIGYGLVRDEILQSVGDAAKYVGNHNHSAKEWALGFFNAVPTHTNPWVRKGIRLTGDLDDSSRLVGYFSGLSRGMDINTVTESVRAWTYGTHGTMPPRYMKVASRMLPFFQYQDWAIRTAFKQMRTNPAYMATKTKIVRAAQDMPAWDEEKGQFLDPQLADIAVPTYLKTGYNIPFLHTREGIRYINAGNLIADDVMAGWVDRIGRALDGADGDLLNQMRRQMAPPVAFGMSILQNMFSRDYQTGRTGEYRNPALLGVYGTDLHLGAPVGKAVMDSISTIRSMHELNNLNIINLPVLFSTLTGDSAASESLKKISPDTIAGLGPNAVPNAMTGKVEQSLTEKLFTSAFAPNPMGRVQTTDIYSNINRRKAALIERWKTLTMIAQSASEDSKRFSGEDLADVQWRVDKVTDGVREVVSEVKSLDKLQKMYKRPAGTPAPTKSRYTYSKYFKKFVRPNPKPKDG